ncbi:MAG: RDD family protein [Pirellulaceae bacterium]|nr:RDD family protein [Pirellulaceae bacterium]
MDGTNAQLDTTIDIVTPENISFHYRVAGPFRRWPAYLLDLAVRTGVFMILVFALGFLGGLAGAGAFVAAILMIAFFFLEWFYGGFFETYWNGQTPGKWVMGIRVLTTSGQPINGLQAVLRNFLRVVDMYPLLSIQLIGIPYPWYALPTYILGLLAMTCNRRFQRLGDLVCGTMVVVEERHWLTGVAKLEDPRAAQLAEYLPADLRVSRTLARTLATYVERRRFFTQPRRREVARHLGEPLLERFGFRKDTSCDLLLCALYYRTFIADHPEEHKPEWAGGISPFAPAGRPQSPAQSVAPVSITRAPTTTNAE